MIYLFKSVRDNIIWHCLICDDAFLFNGVSCMIDFKLLTKQLLETYLGSDTLSDVAIQDFLDSNASIIGTENKSSLVIWIIFCLHSNLM